MKNIAVIILFLLSFNVVAQTNTTTEKAYTTKTGVKYHKNSCKYLAKSKVETTVTKAKAADYTPCKVCKPKGYTTTKAKTSTNKTYAGKCTATTQKGTQCKRKAAAGSNTCWQH